MPISRKTVGCPVEATLRVIEGRWKVLVLHHLLGGTRRFNELHRLLGQVSHRSLAKQLRELEHDGILRRKVFPEIPPKVEYSLTPSARALSRCSVRCTIGAKRSHTGSRRANNEPSETLAYPSKEARDATITSGMEHSAAAWYDRLVEMLQSRLIR